MAHTNSSSLVCCVPETMFEGCSLQPIIRTSLLSMLKVICTSKGCSESGFIHPICFDNLEKFLVRFVMNTVINVKKYNWTVTCVRENLWKDLIYHWVMKQAKCKCGQGYIRKDFGWPPVIIKKINARKLKSKQKDGPSLPQLSQQKGGQVRYVPAVFPEYPEEGKSSCELMKTIPGAVFVEKVTLKRGVVVMWREGEGQIRNLNNKEERLCMVRSVVVEGGLVMEDLVGSEVEYQTDKRGKKLVAVMVKVVKKLEWSKGMVTHWVPEELAGVIRMKEDEVLVYRSEFVAGGFAPDIVGKMVKFKFDRAKLEATYVQVVKLDEATMDITELVNNLSQLDLVDYPLLALALSGEGSLIRDMGSMSREEQRELLDQVEKFLPKLAAHPVGYKTVVEMVHQFKEDVLERVIRTISSKMFSISQTAAGARCLLDSLAFLPRNMQKCFVTGYSSLEDSQKALDHLKNQNSFLVFSAILPLLNTSLLKQLVKVISPVLAMLVGHRSLHLLVEHISNTDQEVLIMLAAHLDSDQLLLLPEYSALVVQLVSAGNVKVSGMVLHRMSGRMTAMFATDKGRELVIAFITSATDLQVELVMEEMCMEHQDRAPLIVKLAVDSDTENKLLQAIVTRGRREVLEKILDIFKHFSREVIRSTSGRRWISGLSKVVNSDREW